VVRLVKGWGRLPHPTSEQHQTVTGAIRLVRS
jgi:hypothetical protein